MQENAEYLLYILKIRTLGVTSIFTTYNYILLFIPNILVQLPLYSDQHAFKTSSPIPIQSRHRRRRRERGPFPLASGCQCAI